MNLHDIIKMDKNSRKLKKVIQDIENQQYHPRRKDEIYCKPEEIIPQLKSIQTKAMLSKDPKPVIVTALCNCSFEQAQEIIPDIKVYNLDDFVIHMYDDVATLAIFKLD
jgi:hypothetical protein